jgi:hypothetical protein
MTGQHAPAPGLAGTQFCHGDNQYCGGRDANGDEMVCACCAAAATAQLPQEEPPPVAETPVAETPVAETPVAETPVAEAPPPASDEPSADEPSADEPLTDPYADVIPADALTDFLFAPQVPEATI